MAYRKYTLPESGILALKQERPAGYINEMHWHEYIEIEIMLSGCSEHILNSEAYELKGGDVYIVTHRDFHARRTLDKITFYTIGFGMDMLDDALVDALSYTQNKKLCCTYPEGEARHLYACCEFLINEQSKDEPYSKSLSKALINEIVVDILRHTDSIAKSEPSLTGKALEYIHTHFKEQISLGMLASSLGVTPNYLGRVFSRDIGMTFNEYLNRVRLRYACNMLLFSTLPAKEIAIISGYASVEYMFRLFKEQMGMTPSEYRTVYTKHIKGTNASLSSIFTDSYMSKDTNKFKSK